ncbi:hypothetical protein [uncultured Jatrophihabitans sp.]|uniref:hypothetical protein n=1 Tax=uncultured Jatrophihabitans sp. TaxID=1610747 RepID=UPI0035CA9A52
MPLLGAAGTVSATIRFVDEADKFRKKVRDLSVETRELLAMGASYWDGPGHADRRFAALMKFAEREHPDLQFRRIAASLRANEPLSVLDLTRALLAIEIGWVSAVLGPSDWENVYGLDQDSETLEALRAAQDELSDRGIPASGTDPFGFDRSPF